MNDRYVAQLEARLEKLTEGLFARIFGQRIHAHDVALHLVRALEESLQPAQYGDNRLIAPDIFIIYVNPAILEQIAVHYPNLSQVLADQIVELATAADYRLNHNPQVKLLANASLAPDQIRITTDRQNAAHHTTAAMQPIRVANAHPKPNHPQLVISGERAVDLTQNIIYIGRSPKNDIIIDDEYVSRAHAQLRLRFGAYTLFDTNSQGGTFVNNVRIREHRLQPGDIIHIGKTSMLYLEETPPPTTDTLHPS